MIRSDLSFQQIYNQLLAGKKLVLHFVDASEAENFRTRMHHHKKKQEQTLENLGVMNEDERTVLQFKTEKHPTADVVVGYVQFASPKPLRKYPVIILEDEDLRGKEVPKDLGDGKGQ